MATIIHGSSGRDVYADVIAKIRLFGRKRPSRNGDTLDLGHTTIVLDESFDALPTGTGRGLSERIAAAEAVQLIGAFSDPDWLRELATQFDAYAEPDGTFWGAYGRRIGRQASDVVAKLRADPWTRQAVATVWDVAADNVPGKRDYPCTVALGFTRQPTYSVDRLDMHVTMRSNDAWLGLPYDLFQFTQLFQTVCRVVNVRSGTYTHTAWSLHLYERDLEASHAVVTPSETTVFDPTGIGEPWLSFDEVYRRARALAGVSDDDLNWNLTTSERWYRDVLRGSAS